MRGHQNTELQQECLRLRQVERLSLKEIRARTNTPMGTLSYWLREHPLTEKERQEKMDRGRAKAKHQNKKHRGTVSRLFEMAKGKELTRLQKSKIAETAVLLRMVVHQFNPFTSIFDGDKVDWMVEIPQTGKIWKIQVRWARVLHHGLPCLSLQCAKGAHGQRRFKKGEFDFMVGYDFYTDVCYVWSWEEIEHLNSRVSIHPEAEEKWDKLLADVAQG